MVSSLACFCVEYIHHYSYQFSERLFCETKILTDCVHRQPPKISKQTSAQVGPFCPFCHIHTSSMCRALLLLLSCHIIISHHIRIILRAISRDCRITQDISSNFKNKCSRQQEHEKNNGTFLQTTDVSKIYRRTFPSSRQSCSYI